MFQVAKELANLESFKYRLCHQNPQPLFHCSYEKQLRIRIFIPSEPNFPENFIPDPEKIVLPTTNGRKAQDSFPISWRPKGLKFSGTVRKIPSFKPDLELLFSTSLSCLLTFIDPLFQHFQHYNKYINRYMKHVRNTLGCYPYAHCSKRSPETSTQKKAIG